MQKPPEHLSPAARRLWTKITGEFVDFDAYAFLVLRTALESWDRLQEARKILDEEGCFYNAGALKREHPAARVEKQSRDGFLAALRLLGLNLAEPGDVGRPPGT